MKKKIYISGSAGKTEYLKKLSNENKTLVLTLSNNEKIEGIKNFSLDEIISYIFEMEKYGKKVLPDFLGVDIILNIMKKEFKSIPSLYALTKTSRFASELYNLFGALKNCMVDENEFFKVIERADVSDVDRNRLFAVWKVFSEYNKFVQDNGYLDYREAPLIAVEILKKDSKLLDSIKEKYDVAAVDNVQDISRLQLELVKLIGSSADVVLTGDSCQKIKSTAGYNAILSDFEKKEISAQNSDILNQALFLFGKKSEFGSSVKYLKFENLQDELSQISELIKEQVKEKNAKFSDFAILTRDRGLRQKILDFLKVNEIPVGVEGFDENFENYKVKLARYLNICDIFHKLGLEKFSKQDFENLPAMPRSDREILLEELDLYIENVLSDIIEDRYSLDRILSIKEEHKKPSLVNVVFELFMTLKESESVAKELGCISKIYDLYQENRFMDIVFFVADRERVDRNNSFVKILAGKLKDIEHLYTKLLNQKPPVGSLLDVVTQSFEKEVKNDDAVSVLSISKTKNKKFKHVYIPSLTEKYMPQTERFTSFITAEANEVVSKELGKVYPDFGRIIPDEKTVLEEETCLLYLGMTRAFESLTLSTHRYEGKKQIQPSVYYTKLVKMNPDCYREVPPIINEEREEEFFCDVKEDVFQSKIISDAELLKMNASAIGNYQTCPRKYFYANLLNIKEKKTFSATYGTAVHAIMQVFFEKHLDKFSKQNLVEISNAYFSCDPERAVSMGFSQQDVDTLLTSNPLSIEEMHENFLSAIDELEKTGFFERVPDSAIAETEFRFEIDGISHTVFDGRIDVITEHGGRYSLYDYKTGMQTKELLSYYISENGVNFLSKTGKGNPETLKKDYKYQIPVYYLAAVHSRELEDYRGKIDMFGLKYIRPVVDGGCLEDTVSSEVLEHYIAKISENLKACVTDKIRETVDFKAEKDTFRCRNCAYEFLCDGGDDD